MGRRALAVGAVLVVAGATLAVFAFSWAGGEAPPAVTSEPGARPAVDALARAWSPRRGDCGAFDGRAVTPVGCHDRSANVVIGRIQLLGDPGAICPLFNRSSVVASYVTDELFVCWVPEGGGPARRFGDAAARARIASAAPLGIGTCGYFHPADGNVHAPLDCAEPGADQVLVAIYEGTTDAECPGATSHAYVRPDGWVACWAPRDGA